jgi:hypothetical protein
MSMKLGILTYKTQIGDINNWVIKRILGPTRQETGRWAGVYNQRVHNLHSSGNIIMVLRSWMSSMDTYTEKMAYNICVSKT